MQRCDVFLRMGVRAVHLSHEYAPEEYRLSMVRERCSCSSGVLCCHIPRERSGRRIHCAVRVSRRQAGRCANGGVYRLWYTLRGAQRRACVQAVRGVFVSDCDGRPRRDGSVLECHCPKRRPRKCVRLVQRSLGSLVANHTQGLASCVIGGRRRVSSSLRCNDDNAENRCSCYSDGSAGLKRSLWPFARSIADRRTVFFRVCVEQMRDVIRTFIHSLGCCTEDASYARRRTCAAAAPQCPVGTCHRKCRCRTVAASGFQGILCARGVWIHACVGHRGEYLRKNAAAQIAGIARRARSCLQKEMRGAAASLVREGLLWSE